MTLFQSDSVVAFFLQVKHKERSNVNAQQHLVMKVGKKFRFIGKPKTKERNLNRKKLFEVHTLNAQPLHIKQCSTNDER